MEEKYLEIMMNTQQRLEKIHKLLPSGFKTFEFTHCMLFILNYDKTKLRRTIAR